MPADGLTTRCANRHLRRPLIELPSEQLLLDVTTLQQLPATLIPHRRRHRLRQPRHRLRQAAAVSRVTASHHSSLPRATERLPQSSAVSHTTVRHRGISP